MEKINKYITKVMRLPRIIKRRLKNKNKDITIISNNCIGGVIYKELGLKFNSPTVNLYIKPSDFVKFCKNIESYIIKELEFVDDKNFDFPVAKLGDIKIYFMHYESIEHASFKWNERCKRINFDNIYFIMVDKDGCTSKDMEQFEKISYKNKIILTNKNYYKYKSCNYISGFENKKEIGNLMEYKNVYGKKYYDSFDFVKWFNSN